MSGVPQCGTESNGGPGGIRTPEGICQQVYSLPRLTASVQTHTINTNWSDPEQCRRVQTHTKKLTVGSHAPTVSSFSIKSLL